MIKISSYRWQLGGVALLGALAWAGVYVVLKNTTSCVSLDAACSHSLSVLAAFTWDLFPKSVIITTLLLMLFPEQAYEWWRWFALVAVPYFIWDIATTKANLGEFLSGSSPRTVSDHDGVLFLSLSTSIAILSVLLGRVRQHSFINIYYRVGAYLVCAILSLLAGVLLAVSLFMHYF